MMLATVLVSGPVVVVVVAVIVVSVVVSIIHALRCVRDRQRCCGGVCCAGETLTDQTGFTRASLLLRGITRLVETGSP